MDFEEELEDLIDNAAEQGIEQATIIAALEAKLTELKEKAAKGDQPGD